MTTKTFLIVFSLFIGAVNVSASELVLPDYQDKARWSELMNSEPKIYRLTAAEVIYDTGNVLPNAEGRTELVWQSEDQYFTHPQAIAYDIDSTVREYGNRVQSSQLSAAENQCLARQLEVTSTVAALEDTATVMKFAKTSLAGPLFRINQKGSIKHDEILSLRPKSFNAMNSATPDLSGMIVPLALINSKGICSVTGTEQLTAAIAHSGRFALSQFPLHSFPTNDAERNARDLWVKALNTPYDKITVSQVADTIHALQAVPIVCRYDNQGIQGDCRFGTQFPHFLTKAEAITAVCADPQAKKLPFADGATCEQAMTTANVVETLDNFEFTGASGDEGCTFDIFVNSEDGKVGVLGQCPPA